MKKACIKSLRLSFMAFTACFIFLNTSCGLDTYFVMDYPIDAIEKEPQYENTQFTETYFDFWTNENTDYPNEYMFLGTDIYYKIYSSSSIMSSESGNLRDISTKSETSSKAPEKLMNTVSSGGYGYQKLKATNCKDSPLIKPGKGNQHVYIRLTDYQNDEAWASKITVNGQNLSGSAATTKPIRFENDYSFNFGRKGEKDKVPLSDDLDVKYSSSPTNNTWYVCLFAVAVARDASYVNYYSNIVCLGSVAINDSVNDN